MDLVREDMERVGAREGDKVDQVKWRLLSRCSNLEYGKAERKRTVLKCTITTSY